MHVPVLPIVVALVDVRRDKAGKLSCGEIPDTIPIRSASQLHVRSSERHNFYGDGDGNLLEYLAREELEPRECGSALQDEILGAEGCTEDGIAQGEHEEARKVQLTEGQPSEGANKCRYAK